jgi:hypothetical protein
LGSQEFSRPPRVFSFSANGALLSGFSRCSVPDFSALPRSAPINGISLLTVLALGHAEFIRLTALLCALPILLLFLHVALGLNRSTCALFGIVAGGSVSVSHSLTPRATVQSRMIERNSARGGACRGLRTFGNREVIANLRFVIDERGIHARAVEVEHERAEHIKRKTHDRVL